MTEGAGRTRPGFVARGGWWVVCQLALLMVIFPGVIAWSGHWESRPLRIVGIMLLVVGCLCGILGTLSLGRNLSPFPQPGKRVELVQTGIYHLVRHPLYTGVFCGSTGWALFHASWPALAAALVLGPFLDAKARVEERALRGRFPEYRDYEKRVRRFIPWVY